MASYLDTVTGYGGRSYNSLVVSEGDMPAEAFIASAEEDVKFEFVYGPENNNNVVIPKGKILAAAGVEYDQLTETYRPAVKICGANDTPIGVAPYNVYEARFGVESENTVSPITRNYIKLPLFVGYNGSDAKAVAASIGFGAMWVDSGLTEASEKTAIAAAVAGKYVVSDENGNFAVRTDEAPELIVGQALAVELDTPPAGFLQYCLELGNVDYADFIKKTREVLGLGQAPNSRRANQTFPGLASFAYGMGYPKKGSIAADYLTQLRGGIRFLTDAYFKNKVMKNVTSATTDVEIIVNEGSGLALGASGIEYVAANKTAYVPSLMVKFDKRDAVLAKDVSYLKHNNDDEIAYEDLPENQASIIPASTFVKNVAISYTDSSSNEVTGVVDPKMVKVDYYNNALMIYLDPNAIKCSYADDDETVSTSFAGWDADLNFDINIDVPVITRENIGLPTMRDFKGCVGSVSILLQK